MQYLLDQNKILEQGENKDVTSMKQQFLQNLYLHLDKITGFSQKNENSSTTSSNSLRCFKASEIAS